MELVNGKGIGKHPEEKRIVVYEEDFRPLLLHATRPLERGIW
jgi:hypothetical protein